VSVPNFRVEWRLTDEQLSRLGYGHLRDTRRRRRPPRSAPSRKPVPEPRFAPPVAGRYPGRPAACDRRTRRPGGQAEWPGSGRGPSYGQPPSADRAAEQQDGVIRNTLAGWPRRRRVWRFRRRNGRGRGGARTWRRSRGGDRRYRLRRYRRGRRRFWHGWCCHSTPLTRAAAGNPRRCLADHAGILGDASWMKSAGRRRPVSERAQTPLHDNEAWLSTILGLGRCRRRIPDGFSVCPFGDPPARHPPGAGVDVADLR
jgi:hypothetical protein